MVTKPIWGMGVWIDHWNLLNAKTASEVIKNNMPGNQNSWAIKIVLSFKEALNALIAAVQIKTIYTKIGYIKLPMEGANWL